MTIFFETYVDSDLDPESKLISLFTQLSSMYRSYSREERLGKERAALSETLEHIQNIIIQIIVMVGSIDMESQPKTEFMLLIIQTKSLFKSMDLDSQPKPLSELILCLTELVNPTNWDSEVPDAAEFNSLVEETWDLEPQPELMSLIYQILSLVIDMKSNKENLIFVSPTAGVRSGDDNILHIVEEYSFGFDEWRCFEMHGSTHISQGEDGSSYFLCFNCYGGNHEKAIDEIKDPLHHKHSLELFLFEKNRSSRRKCYCCDDHLSGLICGCLICNFAMNIACVNKPQVLSIDHSKRHQHPLALFPRSTTLICDVCALIDPTCSIYICTPCGFVVHRTCIDFPFVIMISRHLHRISFTPSFNQGIWICGVCRKEIHNGFGGFFCTKNGCPYAAHSKCATQRNIWDGKDLDGVPEDDTEDIEPFVRISDGIIQHFSHQHHHLTLDKNTDRDYNEDKLCQACITPIYFGNIYVCMQCDYLLHEECANLPRKMYHPIHPHMLTLVRQDDNDEGGRRDKCSACPWYCAVGLFYKCLREECYFEVHVKCVITSDSVVHASHIHPLFLTSKPEEKRECSICIKSRSRRCRTNETFNCIECDFALCFGCATLPQNVRYKHDKHTLILSYEETSTMISWCEVCEKKIDTKKGFYTCDEDCCVTLHIECTIGRNLYMKPGSSWFYGRCRVDVVPNKQQMTRPICSNCKRRCPKAFVCMPGSGTEDMKGSIIVPQFVRFMYYFLKLGGVLMSFVKFNCTR